MTAAAKPPVIPEDTCPYIDMVLDIVSKMSEQDDLAWRREQFALVDRLMEHIRSSNSQLRQSGKYWYNKRR
jgi:hypothetical protein